MHNAASTDLRNAGFSDDDAALWNDFISPGSPCSWKPLVSEHLSGKRILITGAGGSIGSALAHAVHASTPASLVLLDTSENGLYQIDRSLHDAGSHQHIPLLGSVCNRDTLSHAFEQHRPEIIFHAAALKHVPLMEQNPFAAIENNALGTLALAQAAATHHAEQLVLVSTDKAVDPLSIMGASKRIAEFVLLTLGTASTRMTAVRLCNVIGSQGSVLPLFLEQIAQGVPLTVTHPDAQRYFITLDRAVEALFAALQSHSNSAILMPDLGAPIRILDLAQHLLQIHASSAPIEFTGLRPGDKLTEHLLSSRERLSSQPILGTSILHTIETSSPAPGELHAALNDLREATHTHNLPRLLQAINTLVPEYQPSTLIDATLNENPALELAPEMLA
jgi:FlaA1/EpsC-like NDP-sugar epimerase